MRFWFDLRLANSVDLVSTVRSVTAWSDASTIIKISVDSTNTFESSLLLHIVTWISICTYSARNATTDICQMITEIYRLFYKLKKVIEFLSLDIDSFINTIDETIILKYSKTSDDRTALTILDLEARILTTIESHKHIINYKSQRENDLLLERAREESIAQFLKDYASACQQRLFWTRQAIEAVVAIHRADVIHCDVNVNNLLLNDDLTIKLCDFQECLLRSNESVDKNDLARENIKSFMPRVDFNYFDRKIDIFALDSTFYHIMQSYESFSNMNSFNDEEQIKGRFASRQFPEMNSLLMNCVTHKCWAEKYNSIETVLQNLRSDNACLMRRLWERDAVDSASAFCRLLILSILHQSRRDKLTFIHSRRFSLNEILIAKSLAFFASHLSLRRFRLLSFVARRWQSCEKSNVNAIVCLQISSSHHRLYLSQDRSSEQVWIEMLRYVVVWKMYSCCCSTHTTSLFSHHKTAVTITTSILRLSTLLAKIRESSMTRDLYEATLRILRKNSKIRNSKALERSEIARSLWIVMIFEHQAWKRRLLRLYS